MMFKKFKYIIVCVGLLSLYSCKDEIDHFNRDKKGLSPSELTQQGNDGGFLLPSLIQGTVIPGSFQVGQNLSADSYAGYLESPTPFSGNSNTTTYVMIDGWIFQGWENINSLNNWLTMRNQGVRNNYPALYATALISKALIGQRMSNLFGPLPYTQFGSSSQPKFDSGPELYESVVKDLDSARNLLLEMASEHPELEFRLEKWDISSLDGKYVNWIKLANTLKLRSAIRMSQFDPSKAQIWAEDAVKSENGGVLDAASGGFFVRSIDEVNPLYTINYSWEDTRLSASIQTYLDGFEDSRLEFMANPATDPDFNDKVFGIRPGVKKESKDTYVGASTMIVSPNDLIKSVSQAESYFLRAEGVLRNWDMGGQSAREFYEQGIQASFDEYGAGGAETYVEGTSVQDEYVDPKNPDNNIGSLTSNYVKWEENADFDTKLEKIITQKWIAGFPEGIEAWTEFRRTGFPKMYLIGDPHPNQSNIPADSFIKRLTYPSNVTTQSREQVREAIDAYLGGEDSQASPLWFDKSNF